MCWTPPWCSRTGAWSGSAGCAGDDMRRRVREGGPLARLLREVLALREEYGGEIRARFPRIPRRVSGYNLDVLLDPDGGEPRASGGGLGGDARHQSSRRGVRLHRMPPAVGLAVLHFDGLLPALEAGVVALDLGPTAVELVDSMVLRLARGVARILAAARLRGGRARGADPRRVRRGEPGRSRLAPRPARTPARRARRAPAADARPGGPEECVAGAEGGPAAAAEPSRGTRSPSPSSRTPRSSPPGSPSSLTGSRRSSPGGTPRAASTPTRARAASTSGRSSTSRIPPRSARWTRWPGKSAIWCSTSAAAR